MSIIIVGGGVTGAILALSISRLTTCTFPIHLIEMISPQAINHMEFNKRAIALAHGTCQKLSKIDIWQEIANYATPINTIYINDHNHFGFVALKAYNYHIDALGQVIELHDIKSCLFRLLLETPNIELHCPARIINFTRNISSVSVTLNNYKVLNGQLLIAADGSNSQIGTQCGIEWIKQSYDQIAITANIKTGFHHFGCAWEYFTRYGLLAMLPISKERSSLIWCHKFDYANKMLNWSDDRFCYELQKVFRWKLGYITQISKRTAFPLALIFARKFISHRVVLIGNAAQTLHPVAGQGLNLGIRDAISLAEILAQTWNNKQDCGSYSILNRYKKYRQSDKRTIINLTDNLIKLFTSRRVPIILGRNIGLALFEFLTPLRDTLVQRILD